MNMKLTRKTAESAIQLVGPDFPENLWQGISTAIALIFSAVLLSVLSVRPALADISPTGCTGSGLGINLFASSMQAHIGDVISFSIDVFNGIAGGSTVCDATSIQASIVTPDGQTHPITLLRTSLSSGQVDSYPNVVTYTARAQDATPAGTLTITANDTGVIHQNIVNSQGGGNQGINVHVLNDLHVVKVVVNASGGTATSSNFMLHVKNASSGVDVAGSPAAGTSTPGTLYSLVSGMYAVSEDATSSYAQSFGGDCNASGTVTLAAGDSRTCTVTNTDIAPAASSTTATPVMTSTPTGGNNGGITTISGGGGTVGGGGGGGGGGFSAAITSQIAIQVIPTPLALSARFGTVTYAYSVQNVGGQQLLNNVRVADNFCSPVIFLSGDLNGNGKLDPGEIWKYSCIATLSTTTTNTASATGNGDDGSSQTATAIATVVVGAGVPLFPNTGSALASRVALEARLKELLALLASLEAQAGQQIRTIATDLGTGNRGNDVMTLQQFLISQGKGPAAQALASTGGTPYFGTLTRAALAEFQKSVGITPASGYFGAKTRAYVSSSSP
jgi:hypothetical protein